MKNFSYTEALKFGWSVTTRNITFFVPVIALYLVIPWLIGSAGDLFKQDEPSISLLFNLIKFVVNSILGLGLLKIFLMFADGDKPKIADLYLYWQQPKLVLKYALASLMYGLMVGVGTLLLIIPGVYFAVKYGFFGYAMVDKRPGIGGAFRVSKELSNGVKFKLVGFGLVILGILILGALALLIGLLWAIPTVGVAIAYVYRKLSS